MTSRARQDESCAGSWNGAICRQFVVCKTVRVRQTGQASPRRIFCITKHMRTYRPIYCTRCTFAPPVPPFLNQRRTHINSSLVNQESIGAKSRRQPHQRILSTLGAQTSSMIHQCVIKFDGLDIRHPHHMRGIACTHHARMMHQKAVTTKQQSAPNSGHHQAAVSTK